jgi:hypothetical protein
LELSPTHTNTLYNYAVLLDTHMKRKEDGEIHYRLTLELEPKHAYALYNLAVLLEEKYFHNKESGTTSEKLGSEEEKKKIDEVSYLYRRAAECDSRDSNTIADYGR